MPNVEVQHQQIQRHSAEQQGEKGMAVESPHSEQIAQLELMAENSSRAREQRQRVATIDASSRQAAQRKVTERLSSPYAPMQAQKHAKEASQPGVAQRKESPSKPNNTGLPDKLKSGVESLSGVSMDNVRVHYNSPRPAQLNAHAYAQGTDIHLAPGQERHLPHEAWHVVQQAEGRVQPTMQMKQGVPVNDDKALEHEADVMGAKAMQLVAGNPVQQQSKLNTSLHHPTPTLQRMIGFEVEYQIPTYGKATQAVNFQNGGPSPSAILNHFLFGGLPYGKKLGGSAGAGENKFRLTSDHNHKVSTEPVRAKLASMGKLNPADVADADASSNLEYVTSPVDELATGSDKVLGGMIDLVVSHATSTFALANADGASLIPTPAENVCTGTPVNAFKAWLSGGDYTELEPTLNAFKDNIADSLYLQATIGIIPSAMGALLTKASESEGVHVTGGAFSQIYAAISSAYLGVANSVKGHSYIQGFLKERDTKSTLAIGGIIRLILMYLIGEALSQTSAFPGGSIKNAVPFLVKVDPSTVSGSGTFSMFFSSIPDDFISALAGAISGRQEITVKYWRDLGYEARDRGAKNWVSAGSVENLTKMFLQGKKPASTGAQTGSQLSKLDTISGIGSDTDHQSGVPVEYRYIKARPAAAGLKAEMLKIVKEARDINLSQVPAEKKESIENKVKL